MALLFFSLSLVLLRRLGKAINKDYQLVKCFSSDIINVIHVLSSQPYVVQSQSAFTLDVDFTLSELYCNLAKNWLKINGKVNSGLKTWAVEFGSKEVPDTCFDGKSRGEIGLEFISQMWDAYQSPKFAFLNALAAHEYVFIMYRSLLPILFRLMNAKLTNYHSYSLDAAHAPLNAENYDTLVYTFLSNMMARNDSRSTYIFLRSDHGLQG